MKAKIQRSMLLVLFVTILSESGGQVYPDCCRYFGTSVSERNGRSGYKNPGHENQYGGKGAL